MPLWTPNANFDPAGTDGVKDLAALAKREVETAKVIGDVLFASYPGHMWAVHVDLHGKYKGATVHLPVLMPAHQKYAIPIRYLGTLNDIMRVTKRAGGEILERYNVPRSGLKFENSAFLEARAKARFRREVPA